jgi:hypothetical protein
MPPINDGTTTPLNGYAGTITGLVQESAEHVAGMRSIERVKAEDNTTGAVVMTDPNTEVTVSAVVLATYAGTLRIGSVQSYNSVVHRVKAHSTASSRTMRRINMTLIKEGSMTYTAP